MVKSLSFIVLALAIFQVQASPRVLGIGWDQDVDKLYASLGYVDISNGNVSFGNKSAFYSMDEQLQPCINAHFDHFGHDFYFIQTMDLNTSQYGYQLLDSNGTQLVHDFIVDGQPISYLVVTSHAVSQNDSIVILGWNSDNQGKLQRTKKGLLIAPNGAVEVSLLDPFTGEIRLITTVPGFAFLECTSLQVGNFYHYMFEDFDQNQHTMSIDLVTGKQYQVSFSEKLWGMILNFAAVEDFGSTFLVSTEKGYVHLIQPQNNYVSPPQLWLSPSVGQVQLAGSILTDLENDQVLYTMVKSMDYSLAMTNSTKQTHYLPLDKGEYTVGLWNLA